MKRKRRLLAASPEEWARWEDAARLAFPSSISSRGFVRPLKRSFARWARRTLNEAAAREEVKVRERARQARADAAAAKRLKKGRSR